VRYAPATPTIPAGHSVTVVQGGRVVSRTEFVDDDAIHESALNDALGSTTPYGTTPSLFDSPSLLDPVGDDWHGVIGHPGHPSNHGDR